MHQQLENTLYHLTGKTDLSELSLYDLELLSNKYPYFAPIHFFKAAKLKQGDANVYWKQSQQTALFFSNPFWLQYQLNNNLNGVQKEGDIFAAFKIPAYKSPVLQSSNKETAEPFEPIAAEALSEEAETVITSSTNINISEEENELDSPVLTQDPSNTVSHFVLPANDEAARPIEIPTIENIKNMMGDWRNGKTNAVTKPNEANTQTESILSEPPHAVALAEQATSNVKEQMQEILPEAEDYPPTTDAVAPELEEKTKSKLSSILSNQAADFKKPVSANAQFEYESPSTSPAIDYFASQGINIDLTKIPQDKLTVQLRRFTDWLKQMRNVSPNPDDLGTDPELENAVQIIAKTSNESKEVVTEAMAEVLIKQGQKDKAAQLYIKLSFLNPDKSAYFAAKIQELKGI